MPEKWLAIVLLLLVGMFCNALGNLVNWIWPFLLLFIFVYSQGIVKAAN